MKLKDLKVGEIFDAGIANLKRNRRSRMARLSKGMVSPDHSRDEIERILEGRCAECLK